MFSILGNRQGKVRAAKWWVPYDDAERAKLALEAHRVVNARHSKFTNFVEFRDHKLVYRRYAGLYFYLCVDVSDNELVALELIHLFVEALDAYFGNVCELDLVFNFAKVYQMLDEIVVGGELIETSKARILQRVDELDQLP